MALNQRERFLAIGVGVVVGLFGVQYGFNSVRAKLQMKQTLIDSASKKSDDLTRVINDGNIALRQLDALAKRSLPRDGEKAVAQYSAWLTSAGINAGFEGIQADKVGQTQTKEAYTSYDFKLTGTCKTDQVVDFLAMFYDKNYLHTIRTLKMVPSKEQLDEFTVTIETRALALHAAKPDQEPSEASSGRLAMTTEQYKSIILGRNPFSPPNQEPKIETSKLNLQITRGERWSQDLSANDPESHGVRFELVSTELPEGLRLRGNQLSWRPEENGEVEVVVRAIDDGWPNMTTEEKLTLRVVDPVVPEVKAEPPKFDAATQTFVSAIVSGVKGPEAWVRSRVDNKRFTLFQGGEIEVGSIKAKVIDINLAEQFIQFETEGARWTIGMDTSLAAAYQKSKAD